MAKDKTSTSLADAFAATDEARYATGGRQCATCSFARADELNRECARWNELRREGRTHASWAAFMRVLQSPSGLGYPVRRWASLRNHLTRCLGWTIH